jgi:hypothetical protein
MRPPSPRRRPAIRLPAEGLQALIGYLLLAWLLVRFAAPEGGMASMILAGGILAGFPLAILVARWARRHAGIWRAPGWAVVGVAVVAAGALPLGCMVLQGDRDDLVAANPGHVDWLPAGLDDLPGVTNDPARLRLRIRGLTLIADGDGHGAGAEGGAVLLLDTRLDRRAGREELVVTVELKSSVDGAVHWSEDYRVSTVNTEAVHALLRRALAEAMRHTREGWPNPQLV